MVNWSYNDTLVTSAPETAKAFVYYMEFEDGTKYIGKKNLQSIRKKKIEGKVRKQKVVTESNWKNYTSSSSEVKQKIKAGHKLVKREILCWCYTLGEASYKEAELQFKHGVLLSDTWLNRWIYVKVYKSNI
jgi:hypothetical protein